MGFSCYDITYQDKEATALDSGYTREVPNTMSCWDLLQKRGFEVDITGNQHLRLELI